MSVLLVATGGTIASRPSAEGVQGALDGAALLARAGIDGSDIDVVDLNQGPSWSFTPDEAVAVARAALDGATTHDGVVVTHGTDAVEESLFLTWLLAGDGRTRAPIVFTAAMRDADAPDADGPANLAHAIDAARTPATAALGPVLAFGGRLHAARWVTKVHATALDAFASVGGVDAVPSPAVPAALRPELRVVQVPAAIGADPDLLGWLLDRGARGVVVEGTGAGNINRALVPGVERALAASVPVVVTTRCPAGEVAPIYGGPGGGFWLAEQGVTGGGDLQTHKARWALAVAMGIDPTPDAVRSWFATLPRGAP